jgi:sigma-E factor negative regulatory protein RseB
MQLPKGFALTHKSYHGDADAKGVAAKELHLLYSDGLASVSIFVETIEQNHQYHTGTSSMGAVNVYSYINNNHFITAVGEVPTQTVQLMAKSMTKMP